LNPYPANVEKMVS